MIKNKNKIHIFYNGTDIHKYFTFDTTTWCKEAQRKLVWSLFLPATVNIQEPSVEKLVDLITDALAFSSQ